MRSLAKKRRLREKKKKVQNILYWALCGVIFLFVLFGSRFNLIHYWQTKRTNKQLKVSIQRFSEENLKLKELKEDLKNNPETWERIAREVYGLQKKGERVIKFQESNE